MAVNGRDCFREYTSPIVDAKPDANLVLAAGKLECQLRTSDLAQRLYGAGLDVTPSIQLLACLAVGLSDDAVHFLRAGPSAYPERREDFQRLFYRKYNRSRAGTLVEGTAAPDAKVLASNGASGFVEASLLARLGAGRVLVVGGSRT